jgi:colanic acid/amylovoran biosynthesis protein
LSKRPVRILIAEWIPSLNKGELAILKGMLKTFQALGKVEVSIFSFFSSLDKERYPKNMKLIDVSSELYLRNPLSNKSKLNVFRNFLFATLQHLSFGFLHKIAGKKVLKITNKTIWKEYCNSDIIIICHDQVNSVSGFILDFSPVYITLLAKALNKPIAIYANGTYNFGRKIWKIPATYVLNNVDLITARTEESFLYLKEFIWNKARIHLTGDPAILLPPANSETTKDIMHEKNINKNEKLLVGATLSREVLLNAFRTYKNSTMRYQKAITEIARLFDRLTGNLQAIIVFIPHCIEPYRQRDDRIVAKGIADLMKNKHKVRVINKEYSPEELKGLMAEFDLFISTRVHAAISALSMGIPTITLTSSTDIRAHGLVGKNLNQEEWVYNVENLDVNRLFARITDLLYASDEIRKTLPSIVISAREQALLNGRLLKVLLYSRFRKARPDRHR